MVVNFPVIMVILLPVYGLWTSQVQSDLPSALENLLVITPFELKTP